MGLPVKLVNYLYQTENIQILFLVVMLIFLLHLMRMAKYNLNYFGIYPAVFQFHNNHLR